MDEEALRRLLEMLQGQERKKDTSPHAAASASEVHFTGNSDLAEITQDGTAIVSKAQKTTVYSREVISVEDTVSIRFSILVTKDSAVLVGLVGENCEELCHTASPGAAELAGSLGCGVAAGHVFLVQNSEPFFLGDCSTDEPIDVRFDFRRGKVSIAIGSGRVDSEELQGTTFADRYRIAVGFTAVDQSVLVTAARFVGETVFHMKDPFRSTNVLEAGTAVECVANARSTNASEEVFNGGDEVNVTVHIDESEHQIVAIGVVEADTSEELLAQHAVGEQELTRSIGCACQRGDAAILFEDRSLIQKSCPCPQPVRVQMKVKERQLSFTVGTTQVTCDDLENIRLTGQYRFAISLLVKGQRAHIHSSEIIPSSEPEPEAAPYSALHPVGLDESYLPVTAVSSVPDEAGLKTCVLRPGEGYRWSVAEYSKCQLDDSCTTATASEEGSVVFSEQIFDALAPPKACDGCGLGTAPATFNSNVYKCKECFDFDYCDQCFYSSAKHKHERESFGVKPAGVYHEIKVKGQGKVTIALIKFGQELDYAKGEVAPVAEEALELPENGVAGIRVIPGRVGFLCNGHYTSQPALAQGSGPFRLAVRFTSPDQKITIEPVCEKIPAGTPVEVTSDTAFLAQEAKFLKVYRAEQSHLTLPGTVLEYHSSGAIGIATSDVEVLWVPAPCVIIKGPVAPPLYSTFVPGDKVTRNPAYWRYGVEDHKAVGAVEEMGDGWVTVKWAEGSPEKYRLNEIVRFCSKGLRVARYPCMWRSKDIDGKGFGVVLNHEGDSVEVLWDNGTKHKHKYNLTKHEVQFAPEGSPTSKPSPPPPTQPPPKTATTESVITSAMASMGDGAFRPPIRIPPKFIPPSDFAAYLRDQVAPAVRLSVPQFDIILQDSLAVASDRVARVGGLSFDQALAVALFTHNLGMLSEKEDGSDNFGDVFSWALFKHDTALLKILLPFMFHLKSAFEKLPKVSQAVGFASLPRIAANNTNSYRQAGETVCWSTFTALTLSKPQAQETSCKSDFLFEVSVVDGRVLESYGCFAAPETVLLEPNTKLIVKTNPATDAQGRTIVVLEQQPNEEGGNFLW